MTVFRMFALGLSVMMTALAISSSLTAVVRANTQPDVPNGYHMAMLVHSTLASLDQANRTGNYAVLRGLSAPSFQRANDPARLSRIFARLRQSSVSLAPAILYDPLLKRPAWIDKNGHLRLSGYVPTAPMRIHFDMQFAFVRGEWLLFGISIQPRPERQARDG